MVEVLKLQANQTAPSIENTAIAEDVVSVCETKIENINSLFETAQFILSGFQEPLLEIREEREEINSQLKELLAENEHLRRTDFNRMMQGIITAQGEKEREIRELLNDYLAEQKQMVGLLRESLAKSKAAISDGRGQEVEECRKLISQILVRQDKGKQEITLRLKEFQKEQRQITQALLELLAKGKELKVKDFKTMLKEFDAQRRKERLAQKAERKIEVQKRKEAVRSLMGEFKKKREALVENRKTKVATSGKQKTTKTQTTEARLPASALSAGKLGDTE